ncbi:MAG: UDP-N-acetylglucosamine--N-acetylmuramyl-(pentapeptide) pyrophosphoryl-undecaprenol N-acetylglucosamine transferase [Chlorobi bacterium]|nr:UDP-N-acetylglucosamine--N-acetylmuramyl-(pentapeptide) pyrophosphoryl-undecaprenol N-acetylglucosamine transferase [Chlorobiota bacterium]
MKKRILIAPLNWGLGHATRCIPIINALIAYNFEVIIASDGDALKLLKKEFPNLITLELPFYDIEYSKKELYFKLKFLKSLPRLFKIIKLEQKFIKNIIEDYKIDGIISDNRFGVYSQKIPSVYITHQLHVLSGSTTWLTSRIHQRIIKKFNECWIPDTENKDNLSGKLGHLKQLSIPVKYLGILSRFNTINTEKIYDVLVLLSGPEPQRTILEELLLKQIKNFKGTVLFVKGTVEEVQTKTKNGHITLVNFMQSDELETAINQSDLIISRSGYTTILDLAKLGKKAFFIPTPGQSEQEYLAKRLSNKGIVPYSKQNDFTIKKLDVLKNYTGFNATENTIDFNVLFRLFKRE